MSWGRDGRSGTQLEMRSFGWNWIWRGVEIFVDMNVGPREVGTEDLFVVDTYLGSLI